MQRIEEYFTPEMIRYMRTAIEEADGNEVVEYLAGKDIKMERMNFPQGENALVDYLYFNGPAPNDAKYPLAMTLEGGLINAPEELADVRGQVTSDYQDVLEKRWVEELKAKYPAVVNKKVLKKVKK